MLNVLDALEQTTDDLSNLTTCFENLKSSNVYEGFIYEEMVKYVERKASDFIVSENKRPTRTRSEKTVDKQLILAWLRKYIDSL